MSYKKIKRIYHHYMSWEEHHAKMWHSLPKEEFNEMLPKAIEFTGNHELYGAWMLKVLKVWPISCEQNLTDNSINRRAWIGHAACCLAIGCPENITRQAWHYLTKDQQDDANNKADQAISIWENRQEKIKCLSQKNLWE
jgi:hypothetical protein